MDLALFFRRPGIFFSIEELFDTVATHLPTSINVKRLVAPRGGAGTTALLTNSRWARRNRAEVNHVTGDIHYVALALPGGQTVLTVHDLRILGSVFGIKKLLLKLLWFTLPVRHVARVTVVSESTRSELLRLVPVNRAKVQVIPNCIPPCFVYTPREFNRDKPNVLQVGVTDNKNLTGLARALSGINCSLTILGEPSSEHIRLLHENGIDFNWTSGLSLEGVVRLYQECDLVTFVSTHEGFGRPIIEGNAVGRPVITSCISSMPEVAGDAALLVDPFAVTEIRAAILAVIQQRELRDTLVRKGQKNVERFSPGTIAATFATLYDEVYRQNVAM